MALSSGARLGVYEIVNSIGAGGMGEVYRARDSRLGRDVAIKVLPDTFAADPERIARFQREAKTLALLNHPHIGAIYGLEESNGVKALVLELVEGPTLADRIAQGPIPIDEALPIAKQIAEALEAAHEHGIIHRDLKPANIKLKSDGTVKVLDFGLAKAVEGSSAFTDLSASPTITSPAMTVGGVILGTAAYMSPEQAKGKLVDRRTDIWAFGCVFYEMLTAQRAFQGEDVSETLAEIIKGEPNWALMPPQTPYGIKRLIRRCLAKDRKARLSDAAVLRLDIDDSAVAAGATDVITSGSTKLPRRTLLIVGSSAFVLGLCISAAGGWLLIGSRRSAVGETMRFAIPLPSGLAPSLAGGRRLSISPDGRYLAYVTPGTGTVPRMFVRSLDSLDARELHDAGGSPIFSPDSRWIAFIQRGELRKISATGGPSIPICRVNGLLRGAVWAADDTIIFATNDTSTGLFQVSANGGDPKQITKPGGPDQDHWFPSVLPGGKHVLFTMGATVMATDKAQIAVARIDGTEQRVLVRSASNAQYVDTGHLLYMSGSSLLAVRFDPARLEVLSDPVAVIEQLSASSAGIGEFNISDGGTLAYVPFGTGNLMNTPRSLVWVDRRGTEEPVDAQQRAYFALRISPDGTRAAVDIRDQQNDIWVWNFERRTLTQLTFHPAADVFPVWSSRGDRIFFASSRAGAQSIYLQMADGTGSVERLTTASTGQFPMSVSPDGKAVLLWEQNPSAGNDISMLQVGDKVKPTSLISAQFNQGNADISPDGRWIAYQSNESGQDQVYVRPFPDVNGGRWLISTGGGTKPVWSRDGRELFYLGLNNNGMFVVPLQTQATFGWGSPVKLFEGRYFSANQARSYDVSRDGKRFLMIKDSTVGAGAPQETQASMVVVLNWFEELKRLVPVN